MLVLLIIFMVTAPMMQQGLAGQPAAGAAGRPDQRAAGDRHAARRLPADPHRATRIENVRLDILQERLRQAILGREDKSVFIRADAAASMQDLLDVTDKLKEAGVDKVGLMSKPRDPRRHPARSRRDATKLSATSSISGCGRAQGLSPDARGVAGRPCRPDRRLVADAARLASRRSPESRTRCSSRWPGARSQRRRHDAAVRPLRFRLSRLPSRNRGETPPAAKAPEMTIPRSGGLKPKPAPPQIEKPVDRSAMPQADDGSRR